MTMSSVGNWMLCCFIRIMDNIEGKIQIVQFTETVCLYFIYMPDGYEFKEFKIDNHESKYIGRLKSFNRLKILEHWKEQNGCLVTAFTKLLNTYDWDFDKFPNPIAVLTMSKN